MQFQATCLGFTTGSMECARFNLQSAIAAAQLVISAETVKKHVGNLCAKLGAGNRTEAAARARELGLLG